MLRCLCRPARRVQYAKPPCSAVLLLQPALVAAAGRLLELLHVLLQRLPARRTTVQGQFNMCCIMDSTCYLQTKQLKAQPRVGNQYGFAGLCASQL
jgi:hypothetical protein